jgi:hypothetical protein
MSKAPKKERVIVDLTEIDKIFIQQLQLNKWLSDRTSTEKDMLIRRICEDHKIPYLTDKAYDVIYVLLGGDVNAELVSWTGGQIPWKERYETLLKLIKEDIIEEFKDPKHHPIINAVLGIIGKVDTQVKNTIESEKSYKPMIRSISGDINFFRIHELMCDYSTFTDEDIK